MKNTMKVSFTNIYKLPCPYENAEREHLKELMKKEVRKFTESIYEIAFRAFYRCDISTELGVLYAHSVISVLRDYPKITYLLYVDSHYNRDGFEKGIQAYYDRFDPFKILDFTGDNISAFDVMQRDQFCMRDISEIWIPENPGISAENENHTDCH